MSTPRKLLLLAPAVATVVLASLASSSVAHTPTVIERKGAITAWSIAANGRVYLRLADLQQGGTTDSTWFVTPPNRTETTNLEEVVLEAVLSVRATPDRPNLTDRVPILTVRGDVSNQETGKSIEQAIPLLMIAQL
jgi:hypothetical protein